MEEILKYVESKKSLSNLNSGQAEKAGFTVLAKKLKILEAGYVVIPENKIISYLLTVCQKDKKYHRVKQYTTRVEKDNLTSICDCFFHVSGFLTRTEYIHVKWIETLVEDYSNIPPDYVYDKLIKARESNLFDYFTVAEVKLIKDPLLLGRIKGENERFFICQWDDDIKLDDLI